jgi:hypothetical protein
MKKAKDGSYHGPCLFCDMVPQIVPYSVAAISLNELFWQDGCDFHTGRW